MFAPLYLITPVERVDVLLSIADVREPVNVCFQGKPENICSFGVFRSPDIDRIDLADSCFI
jgi:hypothetical protein